MSEELIKFYAQKSNNNKSEKLNICENGNKLKIKLQIRRLIILPPLKSFLTIIKMCKI